VAHFTNYFFKYRVISADLLFILWPSIGSWNFVEISVNFMLLWCFEKAGLFYLGGGGWHLFSPWVSQKGGISDLSKWRQTLTFSFNTENYEVCSFQPHSIRRKREWNLHYVKQIMLLLMVCWKKTENITTVFQNTNSDSEVQKRKVIVNGLTTIIVVVLIILHSLNCYFC
jgi:hypothetical protein